MPVGGAGGTVGTVGTGKGTTDGGLGGAGGSSGSGGDVLPSRFYARFDLDPVRGIKELGEILEHVVAHLGEVKLELEIRGTSTDGYDDATRRTVSENATNLGASGPEFA